MRDLSAAVFAVLGTLLVAGFMGLFVGIAAKVAMLVIQ